MRRELNVNSAYILYHRLRHLLKSSIPLNTDSDDCQPFFIIGSGRCGSTLLRELLNQHPGLIIPPESYSIPSIYKKHRVYGTLPWKDYLSIILGEFENHKEFYTWNLDLAQCKQKLFELRSTDQSLRRVIKEIYERYARANNKPTAYWGDKSTVNTLYLDHLDRIFYAPKYIHIVRDGYDVVASFLDHKLLDTIEAAAMRWNSTVDYCTLYKKKIPSRIIEIRYEDLVKDPATELNKICSFLKIKFYEGMAKSPKHAATGDLMHKHHQAVRNDINTTSIGRWQSYFTQEEKNRLYKLLSANRKKYGY